MLTHLISYINPLPTFSDDFCQVGDYPLRKKPPETKAQYLSSSESQIEVGEHEKLDNFFNYLWYPLKVLNFIGIDTSNEISNETIQKVKDYLKRNEMDHVKVSVNLYDPETDWLRTFSNPRTNRITKLTFGAFNCLWYTLVPKKFYPVNIYDQYTDTIAINTNDVAMALFACAQAKATALHKNPISFNLFKDYTPTATPICNMNCSLDVLKYLKVYGTPQELETAAKSLSASSGMDFAIDILQNPILDRLSDCLNFALIYFLYNNEAPEENPIGIEERFFSFIKSSAFITTCAIAGYNYGAYKADQLKKQF